jgi:hypothetical protein
VDLVEKIGIETAQKWCDVLTHVTSVLSDEPGQRIFPSPASLRSE